MGYYSLLQLLVGQTVIVVFRINQVRHMFPWLMHICALSPCPMWPYDNEGNIILGLEYNFICYNIVYKSYSITILFQYFNSQYIHNILKIPRPKTHSDMATLASHYLADCVKWLFMSQIKWLIVQCKELYTTSSYRGIPSCVDTIG